MMTDTFLTVSQQAALQQALLDAKVVKGATNVATEAEILPLHQAFGQIAVALYQQGIKKTKWASFLKKAISAMADVCHWLHEELLRCQQEFKAQPTSLIESEQAAFASGLFAEELAYIQQQVTPQAVTERVDE